MKMKTDVEIKVELAKTYKELEREENEIDAYGFKEDAINHLQLKIDILTSDLSGITDEFYLRMEKAMLDLEDPTKNYNYYYVLAYKSYHKSRTANKNKPVSFCDYKEMVSEESAREMVEVKNLSFYRENVDEIVADGFL